MPYSAKAVANEFLGLAKKDGKQLTPMQLQKLVYFAYGWYLAITGERLLDERIEAWQWGPVVPSLYHEFKRFGNGPITELARHQKSRIRLGPYGTARIGPDDLKYGVASDDPVKDLMAKQVISRVWEIYGKYTASQLSNMTHEPRSPWAQTSEKDIRGTDISDEVIRDYFRQLAVQHERNPAPAR